MFVPFGVVSGVDPIIECYYKSQKGVSLPRPKVSNLGQNVFVRYEN